MSEEEQPLKGREEVNDEIKEESGRWETDIDGNLLELDEDKWETETKFARCWSLIAYSTQMAFNILGVITILVYLLDENIWDENINKATYAILMIYSIIMVLYSVVTLFRFGGVSRLIQNLEALTELIESQAKQLDLQTRSLETAVRALESETELAKKRENNLNEIVKMGEEIGRLGKKIDIESDDIKFFFNDISNVQDAVRMIKRQIVKNEMMIKFYEYEMNDDIEGLNKSEYELFINSLDKQTADTWHNIGLSWRKLKGNDNIIDVVEFEEALDKLFYALDELDAKTVRQFNKTQEAIF